MLAPNGTASGQPIAVLGAGDLVSHVYRGEDERDPADYRFSVLRINQELEVTHALRACDLRDMVKLCQVLAVSITDDGWISAAASKALNDLANELDELTGRRSETSYV